LNVAGEPAPHDIDEVGMELTFAAREVDGYTVLAVAGEIDHYTAAALRDQIGQLLARDRVGIVLDMSGVSFLDSSGLGALLGAKKQIEGRHGSLALAAVVPHVAKIFEITRMDDVFDIYSGVGDAVAASTP
jgi:anti-sigma B factor antagonist